MMEQLIELFFLCNDVTYINYVPLVDYTEYKEIPYTNFEGL